MTSVRIPIVRNHLYIRQISVIVALLGHPSPVEAQISQGGRPYSFSSSIADSMVTSTMGSINVAALLAEDEMDASQDSPAPLRFGYAFKVSLGLDNADSWTELPNGLSLGASQALLLKKIEELTLYMIEMQKENEALKERVRKMEEK